MSFYTSILKTNKLIQDAIKNEVFNKNNGSKNFTVAVVATMSAGKSTTLNAMLGAPLLPAKNEACTAIITTIEDIDGIEGIRARPISKSGTASEWQTITPENIGLLSDWNCSDNSLIEIQADFKHIDNYRKKIEFIDTPGPNNSTDKSHADITHEIISNVEHGYFVFLLNAAQFGTDDERALLSKLFQDLKKYEKHTKVIFVVNKIDEFDIEKERRPFSLIEEVKAYLGDIGFKNPNIIPAMSKLSLDVRQCLNAHRLGAKLPFEPRIQKQLLSKIRYILDHYEYYLEALLNCPKKDEYLSRAFDQERNIAQQEVIDIAGESVSINQLIEVDIMTGIPFLEEMLEIELMAEKGQESVTDMMSLMKKIISQEPVAVSSSIGLLFGGLPGMAVGAALAAYATEVQQEQAETVSISAFRNLFLNKH